MIVKKWPREQSWEEGGRGEWRARRRGVKEEEEKKGGKGRMSGIFYTSPTVLPRPQREQRGATVLTLQKGSQEEQIDSLIFLRYWLLALYFVCITALC